MPDAGEAVVEPSVAAGVDAPSTCADGDEEAEVAAADELGSPTAVRIATWSA